MKSLHYKLISLIEELPEELLIQDTCHSTAKALFKRKAPPGDRQEIIFVSDTQEHKGYGSQTWQNCSTLKHLIFNAPHYTIFHLDIGEAILTTPDLVWGYIPNHSLVIERHDLNIFYIYQSFSKHYTLGNFLGLMSISTTTVTPFFKQWGHYTPLSQDKVAGFLDRMSQITRIEIPEDPTEFAERVKKEGVPLCEAIFGTTTWVGATCNTKMTDVDSVMTYVSVCYNENPTKKKKKNR